MFEIDEKKLFKSVNAVEAEDGSGRVLMFMKNGHDEMLMVDVTDVLDTVSKHAPDLYMKRVTEPMIINYT